MVDLSDAPVIDTHLHGWRTSELLDAPAGGFAERVTMLGMCVLTSGGDPAAYADVLAQRHREHAAGARAARAPGRAARLRADERGGQRRAPRAAARGCDRLPAGAVARRPHRGPRRRRGLSAADHPWRRARARGRHPGSPRRAHRAVDRRGARRRGRLRRAGGCAQRAPRGGCRGRRRGLQVGDRLPHGPRHPPPERRRRARGVHALARRTAFARRAAHAKPVRDRLLERTLEVASASGVPVHIHSGGGDPDSLVAHARPAGLFDLLKRHPQQPVLLIHAGWPWTDEAAFMASILPHVYLDLSIGIPWASLAIDRLIETALGVAPPSKVLYGSDEASEPEVAWFAAHVAREALGRVLGTAVERRWLTAAQAAGIGAGRARRQLPPPARDRRMTAPRGAARPARRAGRRARAGRARERRADDLRRAARGRRPARPLARRRRRRPRATPSP